MDINIEELPYVLITVETTSHYLTGFKSYKFRSFAELNPSVGLWFPVKTLGEICLDFSRFWGLSYFLVSRLQFPCLKPEIQFLPSFFYQYLLLLPPSLREAQCKTRDNLEYSLVSNI